MKRLVFFGVIVGFYSCSDSSTYESHSNSISISTSTEVIETIVEDEDVAGGLIREETYIVQENSYQKVKLSKGVNTKQNEYYPVPNSDGSILYFVGMDRTGQFSTKIDFTSTRDYGGEDIWYSNRINGIYTDAKPLSELNDNNHQSVTGFHNGGLLVYGIYEEAYRVDGSGTDAGFYNGDVFQVSLSTHSLTHLGQPINSIFFDSDAFLTADGNTMLFVTDRNPIVGSYEQKGWRFNDSYWGNTDVWVSERVDDYWSEPINLGVVINTEHAERTPHLSDDKKTLYFSSNGHGGFGEQDVLVSKRLDMNSWTAWSAPENLGDAVNGEYNDWGFKVYDDETKAMLSSESKLPYKVDARLIGDGGIREINLRTGYKVEGKQSGSFNYQCRTDIYFVDLINNSPVIVIDDMLFDFNKYTIKSSNKNILDRLTEVIKDNKMYSVEIIGNTDNVGDPAYNLLLSQNRAEAIYDQLVLNGINPERLSFNGVGETNPLHDNLTDHNRQKNRRVEIIFNKK